LSAIFFFAWSIRNHRGNYPGLELAVFDSPVGEQSTCPASGLNQD
jgi:hypothetical protein